MQEDAVLSAATTSQVGGVLSHDRTSEDPRGRPPCRVGGGELEEQGEVRMGEESAASDRCYANSVIGLLWCLSQVSELLEKPDMADDFRRVLRHEPVVGGVAPTAPRCEMPSRGDVRAWMSKIFGDRRVFGSMRMKLSSRQARRFISRAKLKPFGFDTREGDWSSAVRLMQEWADQGGCWLVEDDTPFFCAVFVTPSMQQLMREHPDIVWALEMDSTFGVTDRDLTLFTIVGKARGKLRANVPVLFMLMSRREGVDPPAGYKRDCYLFALKKLDEFVKTFTYVSDEEEGELQAIKMMIVDKIVDDLEELKEVCEQHLVAMDADEMDATQKRESMRRLREKRLQHLRSLDPGTSGGDGGVAASGEPTVPTSASDGATRHPTLVTPRMPSIGRRVAPVDCPVAENSFVPCLQHFSASASAVGANRGDAWTTRARDLWSLPSEEHDRLHVLAPLHVPSYDVDIEDTEEIVPPALLSIFQESVLGKTDDQRTIIEAIQENLNRKLRSHSVTREDVAYFRCTKCAIKTILNGYFERGKRRGAPWAMKSEPTVDRSWRSNSRLFAQVKGTTGGDHSTTDSEALQYLEEPFRPVVSRLLSLYGTVDVSLFPSIEERCEDEEDTGDLVARWDMLKRDAKTLRQYLIRNGVSVHSARSPHTNTGGHHDDASALATLASLPLSSLSFLLTLFTDENLTCVRKQCHTRT